MNSPLQKKRIPNVQLKCIINVLKKWKKNQCGCVLFDFLSFFYCYTSVILHKFAIFLFWSFIFGSWQRKCTNMCSDTYINEDKNHVRFSSNFFHAFQIFISHPKTKKSRKKSGDWKSALKRGKKVLRSFVL